MFAYPVYSIIPLMAIAMRRPWKLQQKSIHLQDETKNKRIKFPRFTDVGWNAHQILDHQRIKVFCGFLLSSGMSQRDRWFIPSKTLIIVKEYEALLIWSVNMILVCNTAFYYLYINGYVRHKILVIDHIETSLITWRRWLQYLRASFLHDDDKNLPSYLDWYRTCCLMRGQTSILSAKIGGIKQ